VRNRHQASVRQEQHAHHVDEALQAFQDASYRLAEVKAAHAVHGERLPRIDKDPFDRMLVVQALCEPLTLITRDPDVPQQSAAIAQGQ
jgi:PIN domain nuclease of toxin-antitoxin system